MIGAARSIAGQLVGYALARLVRTWPARVIYDGEGKQPYLSRYYLTGGPRMADGSSPFDRLGNLRHGARWSERAFGVYIHHFHKSDMDRELHSHPWKYAIAVVLAGGYREERRVGDRVVTRLVPPLSINVLRHDDFHRVDLLERDAWSLFIAGPKTMSWHFWDRATGRLTPWREFLYHKQIDQLDRSVS